MTIAYSDKEYTHHVDLDIPVNDFITITDQDIVKGKIMDTNITISARICVAGCDLYEFANKLEELIGNYRI